MLPIYQYLPRIQQRYANIVKSPVRTDGKTYSDPEDLKFLFRKRENVIISYLLRPDVKVLITHIFDENGQTLFKLLDTPILKYHILSENIPIIERYGQMTAPELEVMAFFAKK